MVKFNTFYETHIITNILKNKTSGVSCCLCSKIKIKIKEKYSVKCRDVQYKNLCKKTLVLKILLGRLWPFNKLFMLCFSIHSWEVGNRLPTQTMGQLWFESQVEVLCAAQYSTQFLKITFCLMFSFYFLRLNKVKLLFFSVVFHQSFFTKQLLILSSYF